MITQIYKRTGQIVPFEKDKIAQAISAAFLETDGSVDQKLVEKIVDHTIKFLETQFTDKEIPTVEEISNDIEKSLMDTGCHEVAKAYIIYRYEHNQERNKDKTPISA